VNILTLNHNLRGIGTYRRCFHFSHELARRGHHVTMITVSATSKYRPRHYYKRDWIGEHACPNGDGPWVRMIEGPNLGHRWLPGWGSGILDIKLRIQEIRHNSYDAIYGFEYHPNVSWPVYLTRSTGRYQFYSDWCDWFGGVNNHFRGVKLAHKIDAFLEERIRLIARRVSTNSSTLKRRAIRIGVPPDRVVFVAEGADTEYITPRDLAAARSQLGLPIDAPIVGMGVDRYWADGMGVFRAVRERIPSALLLVIGRRIPKLREHTAGLGLADAVVETGWTSDEDYARYMASADVLFLVMRNDLYDLGRWPAKVSDYLAAGRPTLVTDVGDPAALIREYDAGLVVDSLDAMADEIVRMLGDRDALAYYACRAREAAVMKLSWGILGDTINRIVTE
jgi:glycosyltransferase involved in cell wall biosynthesis